MVRPSLPAFTGLFALLLAACGQEQAPTPQLPLQPSGDSVIVSFAEATDGTWLGGQRWAVLLPGGPVVNVVDFASASTAQLGTKAELESPYSLFRAGDTLFSGEPLKRRLTVWNLAGGLARTQPASDLVRGALPRARDGADHFYSELRPSAGPDGSGNRDSAVVVRMDGNTVDTVARLAPLDLAKVQSPTGERFERRVFSGVDRWGVYPDGTVWLARVYHNRVDFRQPDGKVLKGDPSRAPTATFSCRSSLRSCAPRRNSCRLRRSRRPSRMPSPMVTAGSGSREAGPSRIPPSAITS
jgi:hypothetical protein